MKKKFPAIEEVEFDEDHGSKRTDLKPDSLKFKYNLRKNRFKLENKNDNNVRIDYEFSLRENIAGLGDIQNYIEKRNFIMNIQKQRGYVTFLDCQNMSLSEFAQIKNYLESIKLINHRIELKNTLQKIDENLLAYVDDDEFSSHNDYPNMRTQSNGDHNNTQYDTVNDRNHKSTQYGTMNDRDHSNTQYGITMNRPIGVQNTTERTHKGLQTHISDTGLNKKGHTQYDNTMNRPAGVLTVRTNSPKPNTNLEYGLPQNDPPYENTNNRSLDVQSDYTNSSQMNMHPGYNMSQNNSFNNTHSQFYDQQRMFQKEFLHYPSIKGTRDDQFNNQVNGQGVGFIRPCDIICDESRPKKYKSWSQDPKAFKTLLNHFDKMFPINQMKFKEIAYDQCKNCNKKCKNIENNDLYFNLKDDIVLCKNCLRQGKFSDETAYSDYKAISEIKNKIKISDLDILTAVYKNGDDWTAIAQELDTPEEECVIRFLKIDLTEKMALDGPVFEYSANRIMAVVSFICTCVDPKIASEFAKAILRNYDNGYSEEDLISKGLFEAKNFTPTVLSLEEKKFERVCEVLLLAQTRKLELKELALKDLNNHFTSQKTELVKYRDMYRAEFEEMRKEKN